MTRLLSHDCHEWTGGNTRKRSWKGFNHTKYQRQPGRAMNCDIRCKPAIGAWPLLSKRIHAQSSAVTQQGRNLKLKGCLSLLKKMMGVLSTMKFLRDLLSQRLNALAEFCVSLCLTSYNWTNYTLVMFINKKDVLDCIESNSVVGGRSVGRERNLVHTCLGK
jgi:hypothetical protein